MNRTALSSASVVMWKHLWNPRGEGLEHLVRRRQGVDSVILWTAEDGRPCRLTYELEWDERGCTRRLSAQAATSDGSECLELIGNGRGSWSIGGQVEHALDGCLDVDLWPTPFTNSLPIRRLKLEHGAMADIQVVYVVAPELEVTEKRQRYTNLGGGAYRFESVESGFTADLTVDERGLVLLYPDLFRRIA